jgi:hypothetical protein
MIQALTSLVNIFSELKCVSLTNALAYLSEASFNLKSFKANFNFFC